MKYLISLIARSFYSVFPRQDRHVEASLRVSPVCHAPGSNMTPPNPIKHDNPGLTYYSFLFSFKLLTSTLGFV